MFQTRGSLYCGKGHMGSDMALENRQIDEEGGIPLRLAR